MTVSPKRQARNSRNSDRKSLKKRFMQRLLRMESLEKRQLMAADFMPFHNYLVESDVDGDFAITPLDALVVINQLNSAGSGSLANREAPTNRNGLVDVNADNALSPLDALIVINALNSGEGAGELVEVKYQFLGLDANGQYTRDLDPNPADTVAEAVVGTGEKFVIRTQMSDLRASPTGIFAAYHDLAFKNQDASTTEKIAVQWGEYNLLRIDKDIRSGSFKLQYGTETTTTITPVFTSGFYDTDATAVVVQNAIAALPSFGAGNVIVRPNAKLDADSTNPFYNFDIHFVNALARKNIVDPVLIDNTLSDGAAAIPADIRGKSNPAPTDSEVLRAALNFEPISTQSVFYNQGPSGKLNVSTTDIGLSTIEGLGAFINVTTPLRPTVARSFLSIVDTIFVGASAGNIDITGKITPLQSSNTPGAENLGIALFGAQNTYLAAAQVTMPSAVIRVVDRLTAVTDSATVAEDTGATNINVVNNDIDRFGTTRGVTAVSQPSVGGTVTFVNNGSNVTFTPAANYFGPVTFTYVLKNDVGDTATGTVSINVTAVNDAPVVTASTFSVNEDPAAPLSITPAQVFSAGPANESSQTVTFSSVASIAGQTNGTVSLVAGNINYTPAANFFGTAVFTAVGQDDGSPVASTTATITVNVIAVNDAPVPFAGSISVAEDGSLILIGTGAPTDLLTNSTKGAANESAQTLSLVSISPTTTNGGTITTVAGVTTYRPAANFFGQDTFTYTITDNGQTNGQPDPRTATATVTINVTAVNDGPVAVADTGAARLNAIGISTTATSLDVMANDNAGPLEPSDTIRLKSLSGTTSALGGTISISADKTRVVYNPPSGQINVVDSFSYTIEDSAGATASANVEVFVFPPVLPYAINDTASTTEGAAAITIDVMLNDLINTGATKRLVSFDQPTTGQGTITLNDNGTPADASDDKVVFAAPTDFFGPVVFVYRMTDSAPNSNTVAGTVSIDVSEVNDAPVAAARSASGTEDQDLTVQASAITNGLSKGPLEDSQSLTISAVQLLTNGAGTVEIVSGNVLFKPARDFNGQALVRYTVTDNGTTAGAADPKSDSNTLTIDIAPVNDAPVATADSATGTEDTSVTIAISTLLQNDTPGPANETQTIAFVDLSNAISTTNGGTVTQVGTNLVYQPAANFNGSDSFTYKIVDNGVPALESTGTVTVRVSEVNDAPVATTVTRSVFASVPTVFDLTADLASMSRGAANESAQTLRVSAVTPGSVGTVVLNANGTITYTAPLGASGLQTFTYEIIDNGTTNGAADFKRATGTFQVNVSPFIPSTIKGRVYVDDNNTGAFDSAELKLGGVEVTLTVPADPNVPGSTARTVTELTDAEGTYDFELLPPGAYTVSFVVPAMMVDAPGANSFTQTIVAPGGVNVVRDFAVLGVVPGYSNLLENLASNYYNTNGNLRSQGVYAAVGANGQSLWTMKRDGFAADEFQEVVMSDDGSKVFLTSVRGAAHDVYTATLDRRQFVKVAGSDGAKLIRILANSSDLVWQKVNLAAPPVTITAKGYLDTIDEVFAQENW